MRHTNQQPFRFDLPQPPQQKLTKAAHMLELRKDRFDDHLSSAEHFPSGLAGQLVPHPFLQRGICGQRRVFLSIEWLTLIWWYMQIDGSHGLMSYGGSAVVASIGRRPRFRSTSRNIGTNCSWSTPACTTLAATMICACASTPS